MAQTTTFSTELEWRSIAQVVTIAKFRRPAEPKKCNIHAYHVWRWQTRKDDPNWQPIDGMACQCGGLTWTFRQQPALKADPGADTPREPVTPDTPGPNPRT